MTNSRGADYRQIYRESAVFRAVQTQVEHHHDVDGHRI
ncbi:Uncharacterized protein YR821_2564 [Yersinia ruckeri]|uniref:Uncharacterized protein n=1 Tax=Yersinia ruckeri TaxID=29486 RepID=A0A0A8VLA4_YERRU|nr:hypothetical protein yruck0001_6190 [Yersinia ruckeri ATCC 29473]QTD77482.1 Uncharacterized protein YR821_2564 [Yersinia ruckeri]CEK28391.1 hypothetical protein CSF007_13295 [Yersinia ruckeri]